MMLADLTQVALLGTERQALPVPAGEGPLPRLLAQLDLSQRETTLLSAAALCGLHQAAGALPHRDLAPALTPCPPETLPRLGDRAGSLLLRLLGGEAPELLPEALDWAAQIGAVAAPEALPGLLVAGAKRPEWREAMLPVLGQRGRWLAALNPEWGWAVAVGDSDERIWHTGRIADRARWLRQLRQTNPARALTLLAATWKTEAPEDRAALLAVLATGLQAADEAFLEGARDDKRKEVRRPAVDLLARLPDSALVARLTAQTQGRLAFTPAVAGNLLQLKKATPASLEVSLPQQWDAALERDGIELKPLFGFGDKISVLIQLLELVPLTEWTAAWGITRAEIVEITLAGEWKKEFFEAWTRAAIRQSAADWAEALLPAARAAKKPDQVEALLRVLPMPRREAIVADWLAHSDATNRDELAPFLAACAQAWSADFSRSVLAWLRAVTAEPSTNWMLRNQFRLLATRLALATLAETATGWPAPDAPGWSFWSTGVDEMLALAQLRADLHQAILLSPPSTLSLP